MNTNQKLMDDFHKQLLQGNIQKAYKFLLSYIMDLRLSLKNKYPDYDIPNNIYHGYMDMTYFPIFTDILKSHLLKIAVVFNYEDFRFELWLSANNKKIQKTYWELFSNKKWNKYKLMDKIEGEDSIIEYSITENIDFNQMDQLSEHIEKQIIEFITSIEKYLKEK